MTSIMTNAAAMAALQTLRMIDKSLEVTQSRVSSGYRVESAADNAAYWSISTTMRSDNDALSAVADALGLGAARVDTAYGALESGIDVITEIRAKIVAANGVGADRNKIQEEISQLQDQLRSISESASFSGENWLQAVISDGGTPATLQPIDKNIVASFTRTSSGAVGVTTVTYKLDETTVLFDLSGGKQGILDSNAMFVDAGEAAVTSVVRDTSVTPALVTKTAYAVDYLSTAEIVALGGYTATGSNLFLDGSGTEGFYRTSGDRWVPVTSTDPEAPALETVPVTSTSTPAADWYYDVSAGISLDTRDLGFSVTTFNLTDFQAIGAQMEAMTGSAYTEDDVLNMLLSAVNDRFEKMTSAASALGSLQSRIKLQDDFVSQLMDVIDKGVGRLVDADMNEESTRLKALQTQQQLGIQALSIANSNAENILQLFK
jgi:flagellin